MFWEFCHIHGNVPYVKQVNLQVLVSSVELKTNNNKTFDNNNIKYSFSNKHFFQLYSTTMMMMKCASWGLGSCHWSRNTWAPSLESPWLRRWSTLAWLSRLCLSWQDAVTIPGQDTPPGGTLSDTVVHCQKHLYCFNWWLLLSLLLL